LADTISDLRSILTSAPVGWDLAREKEYFVWARRVVARFTAPNPSLKAQFDRIIQRSGWQSPTQSSRDAESPISRIIDTMEESLAAGVTGYAIIAGVATKKRAAESTATSKTNLCKARRRVLHGRFRR
jgi:hypothetical protein